MSLLLVLFLAVLQGIAEFLPISSSAHLRIGEAVFGFGDTPVLFDVMLHIGTLVAVVLVYRVLVLRTLRAAVRGIGRPSAAYREDPDFRLACHVVLAMIPTVILAVALRKLSATWSSNLVLIGLTLLVTASVLFALGLKIKRRAGVPGRPLAAMTWRDALAIGTAQGLSATFRGLSRSGSTITTGVYAGLDQEAAAAFSFLVSIPAVLGALVFLLKDYDGNSAVIGYGLVGAVISGIIGWFALRWLLVWLGKGRLNLFAGWAAAVGVFAIVWSVAH